METTDEHVSPRPDPPATCRRPPCLVERGAGSAGVELSPYGLKARILTEACATADEELERVALAYAEQVGGVRLTPSLTEAVGDRGSGDSAL